MEELNEESDQETAHIKNSNQHHCRLSTFTTTSNYSSPIRTENAFDMLMSSSKKKKHNNSSMETKKRPRTATSHVESNDTIMIRTVSSFMMVHCPVGCGKRVRHDIMNEHLDICLMAQQEQQQMPHLASESRNFIPEHPTKKYPSGGDNATPVTELGVVVVEVQKKSSTNQEIGAAIESNKKGNNSSLAHTDGLIHQNRGFINDISSSSNVFQRMMKNSAKVFSDHGSHKLVQRIHLHDNLSVTVTCYNTNSSSTFTSLQQSGGSRIVWSANIQVRKTQEMEHPVELIVSTSIASLSSLADRSRWVHSHSRLSVPVLKSILQKSIRRRKPLPSMRVAMELADKSLGDLLRRLPIIVLEDCTLHPDMPLLVWLMLASSKDYQIPKSLMKRVFAIVYEMAACPWRDPLTDQTNNLDGNEPNDVGTSPSRIPLSITYFHLHSQKETDVPVPAQYQVSASDCLLWAICIRSNYGGMSADIRMLRKYATLWQERFKQGNIPHRIQNRVTSGDNSCAHQKWSQIPSFIHQSAKQQSSKRMEALIPSQPSLQWATLPYALQRLSLSDITAEGVDFHCSSVLKTAVLDDPLLVRDCLSRLQSIDLPSQVGAIPRDQISQVDWLEGVLKSCMWNYSAGVNFRLPLMDRYERRFHVPKDDALKIFWDQFIVSRTKEFSQRYVKQRLAS